MNNLVNATPVEIEYLDRKKETVSLRRLSIRQLYSVTEHLISQRMPEIVILCTDRQPEWVDSLTDESFALLAQKSLELNFPRAMAMSKTDPVMALKLAPIMTALAAIEMQADVLIKAEAQRSSVPSAGSHSSDSSPGPSSSGSVAVTGNA